MQNILYSRSRLLPAVGPGVAAIKQDAAGHYYILAEPATSVLVFDSAGRQIGQIPNANSKGTSIRYAVGIDLDSQGRIYVADRGANAVEIFSSAGTPVARVPVTGVTSVVALPDGQFAVTKLQSKRLIQIMDQSGAVIRAFGDLGDELSGPNAPIPIIDRGRIIGDSSGNIYFAYTSLPDPVLQRFDRFGYSAYDAVIPAADLGSFNNRESRIGLGYTMSGVTGPESVTAWTDLHSIRGSVGHGGGRGRRGGAGGSPGATGPPGAMDQQTPTGGGMGASNSDSSSGSASATTSTGGLPSDIQGNILSYSDSGISDADTFDMSFLNDAGLSNLAPMAGGPMMPGMTGMGLGGGFHMGFHGGFGGPGAGFGGGAMGGGFPGALPGSSGGFGGEGIHPDLGDRFNGPDGHFHPGYGTLRATATVKVDLDSPSKFKFEKPAITAVGIDSQTQEVWAAIADTLVHLDGNGNRLEIYYVTIMGGQTLKPTAILVEPNRILIPSDPWGIYEFPRPDKPGAAPAPAGRVIPQHISPTPAPAKTPAEQTQ